MPASEVQSCRSCGERLGAALLDLGTTPVANRLLTSPTAAEERFPLAVTQCPRCHLVQLSFELEASAIFDADYPYYSSFSDSVSRQAREHVDQLVRDRGLGPDSFVVEVGSNDGYLLEAFREHGVRVLGIEPSPGPAAAARERGLPTLQAFFGEQVARDVVTEHGPVDVVIANNVMAHVPALNDFVAGLAALLRTDGVVTVQNPWVLELVRSVQFDTIYHEHYCYFSCLSVRTLFARHGLTLFRVQDIAAQGASLRWWGGAGAAVEASVREHVEAELRAGLDQPDAVAGLSSSVRGVQQELVDLVGNLHAEGRRVAAYGAAAKGATLLNTAGLDAELIEFVVDRNVHKQGLWMPGSRLLIRPVEALLQERPDIVLLLAWNVADEVLAQQAEYRRGGGRFVLPVPRPVLV